MKKFLICLLIALLSVSLIGCGKNENVQNTSQGEAPAQAEASTQTETPEDEQPDEISDETYKYWNIDTAEFDPSLFDGRFSVGGEILQSKLTGKTLQDYGYELQIGSGIFTELGWDEDLNAYTDKSNGAYILKDGEELNVQEGLYLRNFNNETDLYSDNTELYYHWNTTTTTCGEAILPVCLVSNLEDPVEDVLTPDNVIDHLGAPTYVAFRQSKTVDEGQLFGYVYVYDDYTLWFEMLYYKNIGINICGFQYLGKSTFSQPCEYYDSAKKEFRDYNEELDYLKEEQAIYEQANQ